VEDKIIEVLKKQDEIQIRVEALVELLTSLCEQRVNCTCESNNYGYGWAKCYDCGKIKKLNY
jgi:hypothetical protein